MCLTKLSYFPVMLVLALGGFWLSGCDVSKRSVGIEGRMVIVADPADKPILEPHLNRSFGKIIETPQPEPLFSATWIEASTLGSQTLSPIILMAASLDGSGSTAEMLRGMLTPEVMKGIESGSYSIFKRRDPWAKEQLLLILVGRTGRELAENASQWSDSLSQWAIEFERERVSAELFRKSEQKSLAKDLKARYGVELRIQHDYLLAEENDSLNFFRLLRHYPDRWLTVAWGTLPTDSIFSPQFIFNRRRILGGSFLDPVEIYDDRWSSEAVSFVGLQGFRLRGLWATVGPLGGGPFFTFGVLDPASHRYYLIDGAVFAPGVDKVPLLWQLDAMAGTFRLNFAGKDTIK